MIIKSVNTHRFIAVFGFETREVDVHSLLAKINTLSEETGVTIQLFDSSLIAGWEHLFFGALNALKAFSYAENISNKLSVECLLYVSGQRQISVAVKNLGIKPDTRNIGVILIGDTTNVLREVQQKILLITMGKENDAILTISSRAKFDKIRSFFRITETELHTMCGSEEWTSCIDTLTKYCIERSSLLVLQR